MNKINTDSKESLSENSLAEDNTAISQENTEARDIVIPLVEIHKDDGDLEASRETLERNLSNPTVAQLTKL